MREITMFLSKNEYSCPETVLAKPLGIVIHYVNNAGTSAVFNRNYFESLKSGKPNPDTGKPDYGSAHDIVGLEGEVVHCIAPNRRAYHCGATRPLAPGSSQYYTDLARHRWPEYTRDYLHQSPNAILLGIEFCHPDTSGKPNAQTYDSLVLQIARYCADYRLDAEKDIFRHQEIVGYKDCPKWFNANPVEWLAFKRLVTEKVARIGISV